jgi:hypothetical protein
MKIPRDKYLHYTALALGFLPAAFFLLLLVGDSLNDLLEGKYKVIPILALILFTAAGYILAWKNARAGSRIMIAGGLAMAVYIVIMGGFPAWQAGVSFGLPFIVTGLLLLFEKPQRRQQAD